MSKQETSTYTLCLYADNWAIFYYYYYYYYYYGLFLW